MRTTACCISACCRAALMYVLIMNQEEGVVDLQHAGEHMGLGVWCQDVTP